MKPRKSPIALALALCGAMPLAAHATPTVSWISPQSGAALSGTISGSACAINASSDVIMAQFWANNAQIQTDYSAPWNCSFNTKTLPDGSYTMRAVVFDARGNTSEADIPITINNSGTVTPTLTPTSGSTPAPQAGSLDAWFKAPLAGSTIKGLLNGGTSCYTNTSGSVARVAFKMDSTALNTDTTPADGTQCVIDTTKFANGTHQLIATAFDTSGNSRSDVISVNVQNAAPTPSPTPSGSTPPPQAGSLDVWFKAPLAGSTIKGVLNGGTSCYTNTSGSVARVAFKIDSTALNTDTTPADGTQCVIDTTKVANGTHQLVATAFDTSGNSRSDVISVNVQNAAPTPSPSPTPSPIAAPTPSPTPSPTPAPQAGSLDVWFKAPLAGATVSGLLNGGTSCYTNTSGSVARVAFKMDSTALNTDTTPADGTQCVMDTTKFANGTHQLIATAFDTSGNSRSDVISVNVQNAAPASPTPTPVGSTTAPANLLFWSGFEGTGLSLSTPNNCYSNGCYQMLNGKDSVTGFSWPITTVSSSTNDFQLLVNGPTPDPSTVGTWMFNELQTVTGHKGNSTQALYSEILQSGCCGTSPQGGSATQDTFHVYPGAEPGDIYFSKWIKLQPDLASNLAQGDPWRVLFEWKTGGSPNYPQGGDFRIILNIVGWGGQTPFWEVTWDNDANGGLPYQQFYVGDNQSVPVPMGDWFKLEAFWHRSSGSDGRGWFAINGQVIDDHYGPNIGVNNAPVGRIMINQVYTGGPYPIYQWTDDVQIWQGFPTAVSTDPWYDPPYAPH